MKFTHLVAGLLLASVSLTGSASAPSPTAVFANAITEAYTYGQCQAIAKSTGKRCKHGVSNPGDIYCWQHMH